MALSAVAIGAVTASVGVVSAEAAPDYPSWEEIQDAKRDEAATQAEIDAIDELLTGLENAAADAGRRQQIADERFRLAHDGFLKATSREEELVEASADAEQRASISKMRAGLIAAHLSRTAGGDLGLNLALDAKAEGLLDQLTAMGKLSEQSRTIYAAALSDRNLADSLGEQAREARIERERLAREAEEALDAAGEAAAAAQAAFGEQQARQGELYAQLALLKDSTAEAEAAYRQSLIGTRPGAGGGTVAPVPSVGSGSGGSAGSGSSGTGSSGSGSNGTGSSGTGSTGSGSPGSGSSGTGSTGTGSTGTGSTGGSGATTPPPPPATGGTSGGGSTAPPATGGGTPPPPPPPAPAVPAPPAPSPGAAASAIAFARAQIGDRYRLAGYGPDEWDCSGLTKAAYASAGIYIGTHSATNQYNYAAARGRLVPYAQRQPGDLIFYSSGGGDMYHVTLYTGGGMMVEAPYAGVPVREVPVRNGDRVAYVARPGA